ncbi:Cthe_2314 family HEPN domain-containing protein [Paenibacillus sp. YYML68]|uniref:Cthe_2314 family HEPN domain-containing protein n=1 Tax=Paenibacillus sp. YYML68 TaxID=2909250 RepID=UPI0024932201|nr:Cthe_2314 family HEPN domain-containing protein [Paenibacillus sp. YYML68]
MLRALFDEPTRQDTGLMLEAIQAIRAFMASLSDLSEVKRAPSGRRLMIYGESFLRALDELEQSQYAAERYSRLVHAEYVDQLPPGEKVSYNRYLYYYKNAIIRLFAILDKLGHFLDERYGLQTERMKSRFSYFTVLRNMHQNKLHADLEQKLYELKQQFREPVDRLRNQRNMEIHYINADLFDDLMRAAESRQHNPVRLETDDMEEHLADLRVGTTMTLKVVVTIFQYVLAHPEMPKVDSSGSEERECH